MWILLFNQKKNYLNKKPFYIHNNINYMKILNFFCDNIITDLEIIPT